MNHEYRLRARLHVAWSWPDLPVRLAVGELGPDTSALRLSLRARRRLRYPARYFDAAHTALSDLESSFFDGSSGRYTTTAPKNGSVRSRRGRPRR